MIFRLKHLQHHKEPFYSQTREIKLRATPDTDKTWPLRIRPSWTKTDTRRKNKEIKERILAPSSAGTFCNLTQKRSAFQKSIIPSVLGSARTVTFYFNARSVIQTSWPFEQMQLIVRTRDQKKKIASVFRPKKNCFVNARHMDLFALLSVFKRRF